MIIGLQLLLWFSSGLLMSILPIEAVHGDHLVDRTPQKLEVAIDRIPFDAVLRTAGAPVREVRYRKMLDRDVAEVERADGIQLLYDARSGRRLSPLDEQSARDIAVRAYRGEGEVPPIGTLIKSSATEYRGPLPAWQLAFRDNETTRIYVAVNTGRITAVRNGTWRLYDFFWGLHIMDWKNHENFNTPLLMAFAAGGLVLAVFGTVLLYFRWPRKRRRKPQ